MRALLPLVALACAEAPTTLPASSPPPILFTLEVSDVVPGQPMTLTITGAPPGLPAWGFVSQRGPGAGPCHPNPNIAACLDLRPRVTTLGTTTTDGSGVAALTLTVPASLPPGATLWFQGFVDDRAASGVTGVVEATVVPPTCGDGIVGAGEACDDGDLDETDGCTTLCAPPACDDGLTSGDETDVDCGGACDACALGQACLTGDDCATGVCDGVCVLPATCADLLAVAPTTADGPALLDPDGAGPAGPIEAWCDMTTDGGGWTLALRTAASGDTFPFWSPHWTTDTVLNETSLDPTDPTDAKHPAFNQVVGAEIRGCLLNPATGAWGCKAYALPAPTTLRSLFADSPVGSEFTGALLFTEPRAEALEWLAIQGLSTSNLTAGANPGWIGVGINLDDDQSCYDARVRFGMGANNETDSRTLNDTAGFGAQAYYSVGCDLPDGADSPWRVQSGLQSGPTTFARAGQLWVR